MDVLTLLARAKAAGLRVDADGDRLHVVGPQAAETIARALGARKAEVLEVLAPLRFAEVCPLDPSDFALRTALDLAGISSPRSSRPCFACRGRRWWRLGRQHWICARCHPPIAVTSRIEWRGDDSEVDR